MMLELRLLGKLHCFSGKDTEAHRTKRTPPLTPPSTDRPHSDAHLPVRLGVTLLGAIWRDTRSRTWRRNCSSLKMSANVK